MENIFRSIRKLIANKQYEKLHDIEVNKPVKFNWVTEVFENINVKDHADETALIWTDGITEEKYTFLKMSLLCNQFLNFLRDKGATQQDVLFIQVPVLPISWITHLVAIKGGFRLIPSATILGVHDIVYRFKKLMPKVVIADEDNAIKIDEAEKLLGIPVSVKVIVGASKPGWVNLEEIYTYSEKAVAVDTNADDPLFLFFTSGTTGMPKVVIHTHFSYPVGQLTTGAWVGLKQGDIHYNIAQPGWAKFAYSSFFSPWSLGATFFAYHTSGRFIAKEHLIMLEKYRVNTFCAPPTAWRMLIQEDLSSYQFSLRESCAAGEPLNPEIIEAWKKGTGITIRDGFGQTESSIAVGNMPDSYIKFGSMGKPTFLYSVVIADNEGNELPIDQEGNICINMGVKSLGVFSGYYDAPDTMKNVFKNGLYYTGDKAYKDADGYLWFVGRDDDVIKSSGYRVGPFEVESALLEHDCVLESAVVGSPHPIKGAEIKAYIVLVKDAEPDTLLAQDIFAHCRKILAPYKLPRIIEFVNELPKTISGKIRRVELRAAEAEKKVKRVKTDNEYFL